MRDEGGGAEGAMEPGGFSCETAFVENLSIFSESGIASGNRAALAPLLSRSKGVILRPYKRTFTRFLTCDWETENGGQVNLERELGLGRILFWVFVRVRPKTLAPEKF